MQRDDRDLLEVLKFERQFLRDGGYGRSPRTPWKPQLIFEDSPTCMNFNSARVGPCSNCVLIGLVPAEFRGAQVPCRYIPFDESGATLDSLYHHGDQQQTEGTVEHWLDATIQKLEAERAAGPRSHPSPTPPPSGVVKGTPLYRKQDEALQSFDHTASLHPKCANPACPKAFHWTAGGKFFRFRPEPSVTVATASTEDSPRGIHGVRHYWLCVRCSQMFTLVYDDHCGVVLKTLWPGQSLGDAQKEAAAPSRS